MVIWLRPALVKRMDGWLDEDNCKNRSEFISKALQFYMGYLASSDVTEYLCKALVDTPRGIVNDNENRLRSLLFKLCVEMNMMMHVTAAHFKDDVDDQRALRRYAVDEVKRTYGQISFDNALNIQRQVQTE